MDLDGLPCMKGNNDLPMIFSYKRIVFSGHRSSNWDIYAMNADGSYLVRLTSGSSRETHPTWSPDGAMIAYASIESGFWQIYAMNADDSN